MMLHNYFKRVSILHIIIAIVLIGIGAFLGYSREQTESSPILEGKIWLVIGDSISEHNFRAEKNYDEYISDWTGVRVINVAASGTGYIHAFQGVDSWLDRIDTFPEDVDFITIMGGLNDRHYPVGEQFDTDLGTLYGGLYEFYDRLIEKYPTTPIGVITSTPRYYCYGEDGEFVEHIDAVIDVAGHYSLPVLDLYRNSGLRPWNAENNKAFFHAQRRLREMASIQIRKDKE